jgi:hypothetical protein
MAALLRTELHAQRKNFDHIMKQNFALLAAMAKGNSSGGGGGGDSGGNASSSGGSVGSDNRRHDSGTKAMCPKTATRWLSMCKPTVSRSQQTRTRSNLVQATQHGLAGTGFAQ